MIPHSMRLGAVAVALTVALSGCANKKNEGPPCPPVYILGDANHVVRYRPGQGRDLTDVDYEAEIVGFKGQCGYKSHKDKEAGDLLVDLQVTLDLKRGPANTSRKADLAYFVAIPAFYPKPQAKEIFPVTVQFPEGTNSVRHTDEVVSLTIPMKVSESVDSYEVYLGIQTSPEELERNRSQK